MIPRRMAREDKPYRVYRGGRATGGVPTLTRPSKPERRKKAAREAPKPRRYAGPGPAKKTRRFGTGRIITLVVIGLILFLIGSTVPGYLAVRRGVEEANDRLGEPAKAQLTPVDGWMLSEPSTTLIVGSDHSSHPTRRGNVRVEMLRPPGAEPAPGPGLDVPPPRPVGRSQTVIRAASGVPRRSEAATSPGASACLMVRSTIDRAGACIGIRL